MNNLAPLLLFLSAAAFGAESPASPSASGQGTNVSKSGPAAWEPITCMPADPPVEALFDVATALDDFEGEPVKWQAEHGGQNAEATLRRDTAEYHDGKASLRVDYAFTGRADYDYIQLDMSAEIPRPGLGFGFWLKSDGTPFAYRLRFADASGETHQIDLFSLERAGWQFVAADLADHGSSWGGDGNGRVDYPCRLTGICVDRPQRGYTGKGALWIDGVALLKPSAIPAATLAVEACAKRFGNVYAVGERVALRARGEGERIRWSVTDFWGRGLAAGQGQAGHTELAFVLDRSGFFTCRLELLVGDKVAETRLFNCAALSGGKEPRASDFLGMCSHFGQSAYPLEVMDLMRGYGIDQFRDEIAWPSYETAKGRYAMPAYADAFLKRASALKLRPLIIFDYSHPLYDQGGYPNSAEAIAAFAAFSADLALRTRGKVNQFEVWNEWCGGCGMGGRPGAHDGPAYGRLLKPTYLAVKQAVPEATVVGIGGEYGERCAENILGAIGDAGPRAMDAWSIHPYRYPASPEASDLTGEVSRVAGRVAASGATQKAWITEIGYPTHRTLGGCDPAAQARYAVRTAALLQSLPQVGKVFWYDFKDDGLDRTYNENNFGVVHHQEYNCAPKPAAVALATFIRMTGGSSAAGLRRANGVYAAAYLRADGEALLIAWTERGTREVRVSGKLGAAFDLMGNQRPCGVTVTVTADPMYLVGRNLVLEGL